MQLFPLHVHSFSELGVSINRLNEMYQAARAKKLTRQCFDSTLIELRAAMKNARRVMRESDNVERVKRAELRLARIVIRVLG